MEPLFNSLFIHAKNEWIQISSAENSELEDFSDIIGGSLENSNDSCHLIYAASQPIFIFLFLFIQLNGWLERINE